MPMIVLSATPHVLCETKKFCSCRSTHTTCALSGHSIDSSARSLSAAGKPARALILAAQLISKSSQSSGGEVSVGSKAQRTGKDSNVASRNASASSTSAASVAQGLEAAGTDGQLPADKTMASSLLQPANIPTNEVRLQPALQLHAAVQQALAAAAAAVEFAQRAAKHEPPDGAAHQVALPLLMH